MSHGACLIAHLVVSMFPVAQLTDLLTRTQCSLNGAAMVRQCALGCLHSDWFFASPLRPAVAVRPSLTRIFPSQSPCSRPAFSYAEPAFRCALLFIRTAGRGRRGRRMRHDAAARAVHRRRGASSLSIRLRCLLADHCRLTLGPALRLTFLLAVPAILILSSALVPLPPDVRLCDRQGHCQTTVDGYYILIAAK